MSTTAENEGALETRGLEPVPDSERTGRTRELFPTWVAANISVLLLTMGAGLIVTNGLNFWQALVVALVSPVLSYGMVGLISIAGKRGGSPGMTLSRAVFGQRGNLFPGSLIWIARWGWETINAVTGAYAIIVVLDICFGVKSSTWLTVVTLIAFVAGTFVISGLGRKVLHICNTWATYLFGAFSVLVLIYLIANTPWSDVFSESAGSTAAMVAGVGVIAMRRYQLGPHRTGLHPLPAAHGLQQGAGGQRDRWRLVIVVVPMVLMGAVMAVSTPSLSSAADPVSFLGELLPTWIAVPYLVMALIGMLLINSMSMYSAGFTAMTLGIKVPRTWAVSINAIISLIFGYLLMNVASSFMGSFISFLTLLAVAFSAWIGVFGVDMLRRKTYDGEALMDTKRTSAYWYKAGFAWQAMTAWAIALVMGLLFTKVDWFSGPLATSWIGRNGLGWLATIIIAAVLYAVLPRTPAVETPGGKGDDTELVSA